MSFLVLGTNFQDELEALIQDNLEENAAAETITFQQDFITESHNINVEIKEYPCLRMSQSKNPTEILRKDEKIVIQRHSPFTLTELEIFCKEKQG